VTRLRTISKIPLDSRYSRNGSRWRATSVVTRRGAAC
jgi:hypothetical protein